MPGGPTTSSWSGVQAMAEFFDAAGLSGGGNNQLAIVATPLMGQIGAASGRTSWCPASTTRST
jgi:hypothetical protein